MLALHVSDLQRTESMLLSSEYELICSQLKLTLSVTQRAMRVKREAFSNCCPRARSRDTTWDLGSGSTLMTFNSPVPDSMVRTGSARLRWSLTRCSVYNITGWGVRRCWTSSFDILLVWTRAANSSPQRHPNVVVDQLFGLSSTRMQRPQASCTPINAHPVFLVRENARFMCSSCVSSISSWTTAGVS